MLETIFASHPVHRIRLSLIGHSMGCAMGLGLIAQNPGMFQFFAASGMGTPFEPWEYDDSGIDESGLAANAGITRILLAVDRSDPTGKDQYFHDNLARLRGLGLQVETFRPNEGTHDVTDAMKAVVLKAIPK